MMQAMSLAQLQAGDHARVISLAQGNRAYRYKLLALGLTPGTQFILVRKAPLGDPLEIRLRDCSFVLRSDEAALLRIERIGCSKLP